MEISFHSIISSGIVLNAELQKKLNCDRNNVFNMIDIVMHRNFGNWKYSGEIAKNKYIFSFRWNNFVKWQCYLISAFFLMSCNCDFTI